MKKVILISFLLISAYIFSILWRVSAAEVKNFGRSDLLQISFNKPKYSSQGVKAEDAYGSGTYLFDREGQQIIVWRQKVNGFQHIYGSALIAYEMGEKASDITFCGNEYMEAYADLLFDKEGIQKSDILDRRKDLHHNALGRDIGWDARKMGLQGYEADKYMQNKILSAIENNYDYIPHYKAPEVLKLKSEKQMGCPGLPRKFSLYRKSKRKLRELVSALSFEAKS